jgi:hypothetical protein
MGVTFNYCEKCCECLHEEMFFNCGICGEQFNECGECFYKEKNKEKNKFAEYKIKSEYCFVICDDCIDNYCDIEELEGIEFKEFNITKNKLHKKILQTKNKYFSNTVKIDKITKEIIEYENKINALNLKLKELQK